MNDFEKELRKEVFSKGVISVSYLMRKYKISFSLAKTYIKNLCEYSNETEYDENNQPQKISILKKVQVVKYKKKIHGFKDTNEEWKYIKSLRKLGIN